MGRNWKTINKSLVTRGELIMSWDVIDSWQDEMNKGKEGKKFVYPESYNAFVARYSANIGLEHLKSRNSIVVLDNFLTLILLN